TRTPIVTTDSSAMTELIHAGVAYGVRHPDDAEEVAGRLMHAFEHPVPKVDVNTLLWSWERIGNALLPYYSGTPPKPKLS
ncbi:MAG: hypothetical protein AABY11_00555, partial [archaeon]